VLVDSPDREEEYSASAHFARRLVRGLPPGRRIAVGISLGALALLHAHRLHPDAFDALFLQSGSFFRRRTDPQESDFPRFARVARFVGVVLRAEAWERPLPVTMTCGTEEENLPNNRAVAAALARQGYHVRFHELPGGHDWRTWRLGIREHLGEVL
jgi:enterochelin esterase-like enzyme